MPKKNPTTGKPTVHEELEGFEININEFGEVESNMPIEKLNNFLNDKVDDKKLREQSELFNDEKAYEAFSKDFEEDEMGGVEDHSDLEELIEEEDFEDETD